MSSEEDKKPKKLCTTCGKPYFVRAADPCRCGIRFPPTDKKK